MDLKKIIDKRVDAAQYMIDEITHICKDFEKETRLKGRTSGMNIWLMF